MEKSINTSYTTIEGVEYSSGVSVFINIHGGLIKDVSQLVPERKSVLSLIALSIVCIALTFTSCTNDNVKPWSGDNAVRTEKVKGVYGKATWFNGTDAYISGPAPVFIENGMSFTAWIKSDEWAGGDRGILGNLSFLSDRGWLLFYNGYANLLKFQVNINNNVEILSTAPPLANKWHLIAGTYNGSELCFYIDGKLRSIKEVSGKIISDNGPMVAGRFYNDLSDRYFRGALDEIMIFDRALSMDELQKIYTAGGEYHDEDQLADIYSEKTGGFPSSLFVKVPKTQPPTDWFNNIRSYVWDDIPEVLTVTEANEMADHFAYLGINVIFPEHYRYLFAGSDDRASWFNSPATDRYISNLKVMTDACHRNNIRVVGHLTACCVLDTYFKNHPDQAMIDLRNGEPAFYRRYGTSMMCPNNPDFKIEYLKTVEKVVRETGLDGLMVDETEWLPAEWTVCGCEHCRRLFKEQTGYDIPDYRDPSVFGNFDNPVFKAWLKFRIETMGNFLSEIKVTLDNIKKGMLFTGCYCEALSPFVANYYGMDLEDMNRSHNVSFFECEPANPWSFRYNVAEASYYRAFGPSFYLGYSVTPTQQFYNWAFAKTCGLSLWIFPQIKTEFPYLWEKKWEKVFMDDGVLCNTAIVFSSPSKNYLPDAHTTVNEFQGWAQTMLEAHIPFETVIASQLGNTDLSKYSTLILPDAVCLSDNEINAISNYVQNGGYVIATGRTSQYDETGNKRPEPGMTKLFNGDKGKGKAVYLENQPGLDYFVPKIGGGRAGEGGIWEDNRIAGKRDRMIEIITANQPDPVIKTDNIAPEIVLIPYYLESEGYNGISVHLLNCLGTKHDRLIKTPENIAYEYTDYPSPNGFIGNGEKMKIAVRSENVSKAYLISPDFIEVVNLDFKMNDGYCEITIPDLGRYEVIYLVTGGKDIISDILNGVPATKEFPAVVPFPLANDSTMIKKDSQAGII